MKNETMTTGPTIARALVRGGWTFALFGLEQAVGWMVPGSGWRRSAAGLEALGRGARGELGPVLGRLCDTGERLGTGLVDTLAELAAGVEKPAAAAWEALGRAATGVPRPAGTGSEPGGEGR